MNRSHLYTTICLAATGLLTSSYTQAEVNYHQINSQNVLVEVSDDDWQPEGFENGTPILATYLKNDVVVVDGKGDESAWKLATEVEVPLSSGQTKTAYLKALYNDVDVFILVRWADESEDREHHPWVWDASQQHYVEGPQVEDSLLLSFESGCEWTPSLLSGYIYDFDGWLWQAARSDPLGQALDLYGNVQDQPLGDPLLTKHQTRVHEDTWNIKFTENTNVDMYAAWNKLNRVYMLQPVTETLYVRSVPDGKFPPPSYKMLPPPTGQPSDDATVFPQFSPLKLEGGAGEVSAKGAWKDGFWTVEFRRMRVTPAQTLNDTVFNRLTQFSVNVFDHTEKLEEASESKRLFLEFVPAGPNLTKD